MLISGETHSGTLATEAGNDAPRLLDAMGVTTAGEVAKVVTGCPLPPGAVSTVNLPTELVDDAGPV